MFRLACIVLALAAAAHAPSALRADDFSIELKAVPALAANPVDAKYPTPEKKAQPRAMLTVAANATITTKWTVRKTDQGAITKDVLVHFFVVKQEKPDQQEVPKLTKGLVVESALTMDFKAQDKAEGEITFTIPGAGCYLIRLELKGAAANPGGEPFVALDLLVTSKK